MDWVPAVAQVVSGLLIFAATWWAGKQRRAIDKPASEATAAKELTAAAAELHAAKDAELEKAQLKILGLESAVKDERREREELAQRLDERCREAEIEMWKAQARVAKLERVMRAAGLDPDQVNGDKR